VRRSIATEQRGAFPMKFDNSPTKPMRFVTLNFLLSICAAGLCVAAASQETSPSQTAKITVQVLNPKSEDAKRLPKATQFQAGRPVTHFTLTANDATVKMLGNSLLVVHAGRRATFAIEDPTVLSVPPGKFIFPSDVQGIFQAKKAGSTAVKITYADVPDCQNAPHCSPNWSGYLVQQAILPFTGVTGQWTVPTLASDSPQGDSFSWVGIGGWKPSVSIIQAGTEQLLDSGLFGLSGGPKYSAWYQLFPSPNVPIPNSVSPGDVMQVSITPVPDAPIPAPNATADWLIQIVDVTQKWTYTTTQSFASDESSVEWIEELPAPYSRMADYVQVEFNFHNQAALGGDALQPIYLTQGEQVWQNVGGINGTYSTPSNPSGDGHGFYVTYTVGSPNQEFPPGPWIQTTSPLPPALVNEPYSQTLLVNEATSPVWSVANGSLPQGLSLDPNRGTISGIPTQIGPSGFSILATDSSTGASTGNVGFSLQVQADPAANLDVTCSGIQIPVGSATLSFTVDGSPQPCNVPVTLATGVHTVVATVTGPGQPYKITYAGACAPSGQVTLVQGNTSMCTISAEPLGSFEGACPSGEHCCEPTATGCSKCISNKMSCP
jgi:hypothetical protein